MNENDDTAMISTSVPVTSSMSEKNHKVNTHCSFCLKMNKDILRLIIMRQLSISLTRIIIKNETVRIKPIINNSYHIISDETTFYESFDQSKDPET